MNINARYSSSQSIFEVSQLCFFLLVNSLFSYSLLLSAFCPKFLFLSSLSVTRDIKQTMQQAQEYETDIKAKSFCACPNSTKEHNEEKRNERISYHSNETKPKRKRLKALAFFNYKRGMLTFKVCMGKKYQPILATGGC